MPIKGKVIFRLVVWFLLCISAYALQRCNSVPERKESREKAPVVKNTFVGSATCKSCHPQAYADWTKSDHYRAMQEATDSTVLGDFNNATFNANGVTNRFFRKDEKFYINTQGGDGRYHDYQVLYTFGFFPLQQYLVAFPGGRMQATRASWDARQGKWFHQYSGQNIYYKDWIHWTGAGQNWNTMCASCHATNLKKNYDASTDAFNTTWDEVNVSCESCHGPAGRHLNLMNDPGYEKGDVAANFGLQYAGSTDNKLQIAVCAPCHARKADISATAMHTNEIMDNLIPQIISDEFYFADGQIDDEDYVYGSFTQSKMYHNNVRCTNCHNPHSGKLIADGNNLCMSCHKPKYDTKEHHFHAMNTDGAQCISCHMPVKTYMGNDQRRDHSFRVPRPDQSVAYGTPNACTACHEDKTNQWAANAINKWYGPKRAYHFSDDLVPGSQRAEGSEKHLIKLLGDTLQPAIARATAAYYLGNMLSQAAADALIRALPDREAMVRYFVLRSLGGFPTELWVQSGFVGLTDKVRAVRIAAASLYHGLPPESIPASARNAYYAAGAENKAYLKYQTDFSVGNVMLADYELKGGDYLNAIVHYIKGLQKDSLMNYARLNLSAAYNTVGKNDEALRTLKDASAIDPANDRIYYNLGLLYYELGNIGAAMENLQQAIRLGSRNPGVYYNYGLLLQQQGKVTEAEQTLLSGVALNPAAANINYALAFLYLNQNNPLQAKKYAAMLRRMDPDNPEYQAIFRRLGL